MKAKLRAEEKMRLERPPTAVYVLSVVVFLSMLGMGIISPVLPLFADIFGVSSALAGLLVSAFGMARIPTNLIAGNLSARFGKRKTMVAGMLTISASSFLCGLAADYAQLLLFRLAAGFGSAFYIVSSSALLADICPSEKRGKFMGYYIGSLLLGSSAGPAIGGYIAYYFGYRMTFFSYAMLTMLGGIILATFIKEKEKICTGADSKTEDNFSKRIYGSLLKDRTFVLVNLAAFAIFWNRSGINNTAIPFFGGTAPPAGLGLNEAEIGLAMAAIMITNLIVIFPAGIASDKFGRKTMLIPCLVLMGIADIVFPLSKSLNGMILNGLLLGFSSGLAGPIMAYISDIAPAGHSLEAMSIYRTISDFGFAVGPIFLGWLIDVEGLHFPFYFSGALMLFAGVLMFCAREPLKK